MLAGVYTPGRAIQVRQVERQRSDKVAAQSFLSLYFPIFLPFTFLLFYSLFLLFLCFSRPYIILLRCLDVKPLSLTYKIVKDRYKNTLCTVFHPDISSIQYLKSQYQIAIFDGKINGVVFLSN